MASGVKLTGSGEDLLRTIAPLGDVISQSASLAGTVASLSRRYEAEKKLFKDISLSGSIFEAVEKDAKQKDNEDKPKDIVDFFMRRKETVKQVSIANPLSPLVYLAQMLSPEYRFLQESTSALKAVGNDKVVKESILGSGDRVPDNPNELLDEVERGNIAATKYMGLLYSVMLTTDKETMSMADAVVSRANAMLSDYTSSLKTVSLITESVLSNVARLDEKMRKVWEETERTYKDLTDEFLHRESNRVVVNPVVTNVVKILYTDLPGVSEVENGAQPRQVTPYNLQRAERLLRALADPSIYGYLEAPETIVSTVGNRLDDLLSAYSKLVPRLLKLSESLRSVIEKGDEKQDMVMFRYSVEDKLEDLRESVDAFKTLNLTHVRPKAKKAKRSKSTVHPQLTKYAKISRMLQDVRKDPSCARAKALEIYGMHRRSRMDVLKKPHDELENSTYYEAAQDGMGEIELVQSKKPSVKFDDIIGRSYDDAKKHIRTMLKFNAYPALYLSTSPSKTIKSNALLLGPPGSGKSELFRAMAGDSKTVVVNVSGASIRSMWHGRSEQNVVALADAAAKLHEKTGKIVYVVIDEIDNVLGIPSEGNNLADVEWRLIKTFQEILDGVKYYRGVVWCGATNNPERLSSAALRRFAYVDSPGELGKEERADMLRHYITLGLPLSPDVTDADFARYGEQMDGAVGDIVRKVADDLHERFFSEFIGKHPKEAKDVERWLKRDDFDVYRLTKRDREGVKRRLGKYFVVTKPMLEDALVERISSPDIVREIKEAKDTYERIRMIKSGARKRLEVYE